MKYLFHSQNIHYQSDSEHAGYSETRSKQILLMNILHGNSIGALQKICTKVKQDLPDFDFNFKNTQGNTMLITAANEKMPGKIKFLVSIGIDVCTKDKYGNTASDIVHKKWNRSHTSKEKIIEILDEAASRSTEIFRANTDKMRINYLINCESNMQNHKKDITYSTIEWDYSRFTEHNEKPQSSSIEGTNDTNYDSSLNNVLQEHNNMRSLLCKIAPMNGLKNFENLCQKAREQIFDFSFDCEDSKGNSLIMLAAQAKFLPIKRLELLISLGANPYICNSKMQNKNLFSTIKDIINSGNRNQKTIKSLSKFLDDYYPNNNLPDEEINAFTPSEFLQHDYNLSFNINNSENLVKTIDSLEPEFFLFNFSMSTDIDLIDTNISNQYFSIDLLNDNANNWDGYSTSTGLENMPLIQDHLLLDDQQFELIKHNGENQDIDFIDLFSTKSDIIHNSDFGAY